MTQKRCNILALRKEKRKETNMMCEQKKEAKKTQLSGSFFFILFNNEWILINEKGTNILDMFKKCKNLLFFFF